MVGTGVMCGSIMCYWTKNSFAIASGAVAFGLNSSRRSCVESALARIFSTLGRGNCGPVGRVINCVLSRSPACVAARGGTEDLVHGVSQSRLLTRVMGSCLGAWECAAGWVGGRNFL